MIILDYLNRIRVNSNIETSIDGLSQLQKHHLMMIPFENLDIHNGTRIQLDINKLFNKIIAKGRGGFCYEVNSLFFELLISLGFEAKRISAKVFSKENSYGQEYDHLAILVKIGNIVYLSDVGFGEFAFSPLKFELGIKQEDQRGIFYFDKYDDDYFRISKIEKEEIVPQYIFTTASRELSEFENMCNYHQTSPESHFTRQKAISLPYENGRLTLTEDKLKITDGNSVKEKSLSSSSEFDELLWKYFKIKMKCYGNKQN